MARSDLIKRFNENHNFEQEIAHVVVLIDFYAIGGADAEALAPVRGRISSGDGR